GYDYSRSGAYFVTICTQGRARLFGRIVDGEMRLGVAGRIAEKEWRSIGVHFPNVIPDEFVVMPDHVHGVLVFMDPVPNGGAPFMAPTLPTPTDSVITGDSVAPTQAVHLGDSVIPVRTAHPHTGVDDHPARSIGAG